MRRDDVVRRLQHVQESKFLKLIMKSISFIQHHNHKKRKNEEKFWEKKNLAFLFIYFFASRWAENMCDGSE